MRKFLLLIITIVFLFSCKRRAVASPIPELAPVIKTTFDIVIPFELFSINILLLNSSIYLVLLSLEGFISIAKRIFSDLWCTHHRS